MATSLLYLGPYLGPYSILVTAGSGGVYIYSYCGCCGCYRVAGAAIKVTSSTAIGTTYSTAVRIAGGISKTASRISGGYVDGDCVDKACIDRAYENRAYTDGACHRAYYGA